MIPTVFELIRLITGQGYEHAKQDILIDTGRWNNPVPFIEIHMNLSLIFIKREALN